MNRTGMASVLVWAALAACLHAGEQGQFDRLTAGKHLFILSGQSNMDRLDPKVSFTPAVEAAFGKENVIVVKDSKGAAADSPLVQELEAGAGR